VALRAEASGGDGGGQWYGGGCCVEGRKTKHMKGRNKEGEEKGNWMVSIFCINSSMAMSPTNLWGSCHIIPGSYICRLGHVTDKFKPLK
jgi:hypothetical protein